ncbi:DNA replication and repair protein RecF, partial [Staphylococcus simulans]
MLEVFNEQLSEAAANVTLKRAHFIRELEKIAEVIHQGITSEKESLKVQYEPNIKLSETYQDVTELKEAFCSLLNDSMDKEIERGSARFGPHRDDIRFHVNDMNVQTYGSQGQQRTTALSIKLAEIELINQVVGEYPILLLDDVLS